jgi:hypothetical protein
VPHQWNCPSDRELAAENEAQQQQVTALECESVSVHSVERSEEERLS